MSEIFLYDRKPKKNPKLNIWVAFPGIQKFGMASLGYLSVFRFFDESPEYFAERIFTDTQQTEVPFKDVDLLGISMSFEIDFLAFFKIFEKYGLPFKASERDENYPLVFGGGPVLSSNPEPFCELFDFIIIGDGETINQKIANTISENKGKPKKEILKLLSEFSCVYVPSLTEYDVQSGTVTKDNKKLVIKKCTEIIDKPLSIPILSSESFFADTFIIELARGCPFSCKFCLTSFLNKPYRCANYEKVIEEIDKGLRYTNKLAFLGALIAAHPQFDEICDYVYKKVKAGSEIELSVSSLRANRVTPRTIQTLAACGQKHTTIALEAGSERLREHIDKRLTEQELLNFVDIAYKNGLKGVKIYAILGLPTETDYDVEQLVNLMKKLKSLYKSFEFVLSVSTFVPKAHTPFQNEGRENAKVLEKRFNYLKKHLIPKGVQVRVSSINWDEIQTVFSRGDRRLTDYAIEVYKNTPTLGTFKKVYKEMYKNKRLPHLDEWIYKPLDINKKPVWSFIEL